MARSTYWLDNVISNTVAAAAELQVDLTSALSVADRRGITIIRTIYNLQVVALDPFDTETHMIHYMGIGLVQFDAAAGGSFPSPDTEGDQPGRGWMVRDYTSSWSAAGTSGNIIPGHFQGDLRGMRKIHQSEQLYLMFTNDLRDGTTQSVILEGMVRLLIKSP